MARPPYRRRRSTKERPPEVVMAEWERTFHLRGEEEAPTEPVTRETDEWRPATTLE